MCGIIGVWDKNKSTTEVDVVNMALSIRHRGHDDNGTYVDDDAGILLAHQRLSLIDLSSAGHQPMIMDHKIIVYNGEIYNFTIIRDELKAKGISFISNSDTEVLLRAWQVWGPSSLQKFRGMFAFAIWDKSKQELTLCRDRVGVKPLYLYQKDDLLIFASEIKAILAHPKVKRELDHEALQLFLQLGYVPAPYSIFKDIQKVLPAHYLTIDSGHKIQVTRYWNPEPLTIESTDEKTALLELEKIITEACKLRMIADVPVGVFLSGGIDSSLVTAVLKKQGYANLSTFTIGFAESSHNEAGYAKAVAEYLGTDHHELICTTKDAQEIIPKLPAMFDEPFADASAIPTYLLSQLAKQHVTAALSADGGDELFGGYARYQSGQNIFSTFAVLPPGIGWLIWSAAQATQILVRLKLVHPNRVHKFKKAYLYYQHRASIIESYATQQSYFTPDELRRLLKQPATTFLKNIYERISLTSITNHLRKLQQLDFHTYLPDGVLVKVDRASMAVSLEGREPLLDHRLIEFAVALPDALIHKEPGNKYLLRKLLYQYLPQEMVDRPKQGFGVPLNDWLKGDLTWLLDTYLNEELIKKQGIFSYDVIQQEKKAFSTGAQPYNRIWNIIVFQMWYKEYLT